MCIVCNCGENGVKFLDEFASVQIKMKTTKELMLECKKSSNCKIAAKRYDKTHKRMIKIIKQWNTLEQFREKE